MSAFEKRLSFRVLNFVKNNHKNIIQEDSALEALQASQQVHDGALVEVQGVKPLTFLRLEGKW